MPKLPLFCVIGSNSFSGAAFISKLIEKGHPVVGISRSKEPSSVFLPYRWLGGGEFRFFNLDLNKDHEDIITLLEKERPEYIVNFAAQSMVAESWDNPEHWFMTNVVSTIRLHDKLRKMAFLKRYVHISTPEVYGNTSGEVKEQTVFNPSTPYAVSRAAADMSLQSFYAAYNMPVVFTRAANVYGAGQQLYRIIPRAILFIRARKKLKLHGGGASRRSFIHIDDVAEATYLIALKGENGESYHISTNRIISILELIEDLCLRMGVHFHDFVEMTPERLGKDANYHLSSEKLRKELGWADQISLESGIERTIHWVDSNLDELLALPSSYIHKE